MKGRAVDILVKYLENAGVEYIFGVPGGHLLPFFDAVYKAGTIEIILSKHEAGAAYMACGYAASTGKLGVCAGTVGPGATNLITGVATAYQDSVPILALTAQVGTSTFGKGALQEGSGRGRTINQQGLFQQICKFSCQAAQGKDIPVFVKKAMEIAFEGRPGPVHLELPVDLQIVEIEDPIMLPDPSEVPRKGANSAQSTEAAEHLLQAKKPALLVGAGARGAEEELLRLAEELQIPVATTLKGKGLFPEVHPLALGCVGLYGTNAANRYMRSDLDVMLALGSSFSEFTSHCWDSALKPSATLIQVDIDAAELGKNYPLDLAVHSKVKPFVKSLLDELQGRTRNPDEDIAEFKQSKMYFDEPVMSSDARPIKPQRLMKSLSDGLPQDTIYWIDIGNAIPWSERYLQLRRGASYYLLSNLAAMGSSVAGAIGCALGNPERPVVCITGDGAFLMTGLEISTAVQYKIPLIWVILKDKCMTMIHNAQTFGYNKRYIAAQLPDQTDFCALARSLGSQAYHVEEAHEIEPALKQALLSKQPAVIEVVIDADETPPIEARMLALKKSTGINFLGGADNI